jgi:recombination protein RecR
LKVDRIEARIAKHRPREIILAFDSTLEGDTTSLYLKSHLSKLHLTVTRLAFGLPIGSNLESIDGGTLTRALTGRQSF